MAAKKKAAAPDHLSDEAKNLFNALRDALDFRLKDYHILALAEYCETHLECVALRQQIADEGRTVKINDGKTLIKHPLWDPLNQTAQQQYRWAMQLGITPHAEAGSKLAEEKEETEIDGMERAIASRRGSK